MVITAYSFFFWKEGHWRDSKQKIQKKNRRLTGNNLMSKSSVEVDGCSADRHSLPGVCEAHHLAIQHSKLVWAAKSAWCLSNYFLVQLTAQQPRSSNWLWKILKWCTYHFPLVCLLVKAQQHLTACGNWLSDSTVCRLTSWLATFSGSFCCFVTKFLGHRHSGPAFIFFPICLKQSEFRNSNLVCPVMLMLL